MAKTAQDATLPVVRVADREFPIGPVTIHQLYRLKNVVATAIANARAKAMKRETAALTKAAEALNEEKDGLREALAAKLGVDADDLPEEQWLQEVDLFLNRRMQREVAETGYTGEIGLLLAGIEALGENQMLELAVVLLDRSTHTRVTFEWVEQHFALDWFMEALAVFIEHNNIASIVKNSQRLGAAISMQLSAAASKTA